MEALGVLENKISVLLDLVKKLKAENTGLKKECDRLKTESAQLLEEKTQLNADNAVLKEDVKRLANKLETVEKSVLASDKSVDVLNQEKKETKLFIDDLIKDIDSLVKSENQQ